MKNGIRSTITTISLLVCGLSLTSLASVLEILGRWRLLLVASGVILLIVMLARQNCSKISSTDKPTVGQ